MRLMLDGASPVPLYHQIAEALRHRVATGRLPVGTRLPPVREAARSWGVNLHTVRRAYQELVREGLAESRGAGGTRILPTGGRARRGDAVSTFLDRVVREAAARHRLTVGDLIRLLSERAHPGRGASTVHFVECSESQCLGHCAEIERAWEVSARPWPLAREGALPAGPVVATYFHYNEVRLRWPSRFPEIAFVAIQPDPSLRRRLAGAPRSGGPRSLPLCEMDPDKARNIAADLVPILPARVRVVPSVVSRPGELLEAPRRGPILFSPRVYGRLDAEERSDPRAVEVRYFIPEAELEGLGERFHWRLRSDRAAVGRS